MWGRDGFVFCPIAGPNEGRTKYAVQGGKLRIDPKNSLWVPRITCITKNNEWCTYCPNKRFNMVLKVIGKDEDFDWLLTAMRKGGKVTSEGRTFGECCPLHKEVILCNFFVAIPTWDKTNPKTGNLLYQVIMKESEHSPHIVEHVKTEARPNGYAMCIALRQRKGIEK